MVFGRRLPSKSCQWKAVFVVFGKQLTPKDTSEQGVPLVATYHPKLKYIFEFLYGDSEVQRVFSPAPIVSYWSARKLGK